MPFSLYYNANLPPICHCPNAKVSSTLSGTPNGHSSCHAECILYWWWKTKEKMTTTGAMASSGFQLVTFLVLRHRLLLAKHSAFCIGICDLEKLSGSHLQYGSSGAHKVVEIVRTAHWLNNLKLKTQKRLKRSSPLKRFDSSLNETFHPEERKTPFDQTLRGIYR